MARKEEEPGGGTNQEKQMQPDRDAPWMRNRRFCLDRKKAGLAGGEEKYLRREAQVLWLLPAWVQLLVLRGS